MNKSTQGFSVLEAIIALGLTSLLVAALSAGVFFSQRHQLQTRILATRDALAAQALSGLSLAETLRDSAWGTDVLNHEGNRALRNCLDQSYSAGLCPPESTPTGFRWKAQSMGSQFLSESDGTSLVEEGRYSATGALCPPDPLGGGSSVGCPIVMYTSFRPARCGIAGLPPNLKCRFIEFSFRIEAPNMEPRSGSVAVDAITFSP